MKRCYYECLEVQKGAGGDVLKTAYRKLAMRFHPDKNPGDANAETKFKEINEAYDVLKDDQKRAAYDRFGHAAFENGMGAAGGRGVLVARTKPNDWSYPVFYGMGSGSIGLQIGGKVSEIVFIIRSEKGLQAILDHKFKFGAEAGVTMVAVGIGLEGASTAAGGADIVAFSNSAGLFAGASIEGSYLDADGDWNALYYGQGATAKAIALDRKFSNPGAEPLRKFLAKW